MLGQRARAPPTRKKRRARRPGEEGSGRQAGWAMAGPAALPCSRPEAESEAAAAEAPAACRTTAQRHDHAALQHLARLPRLGQMRHRQDRGRPSGWPRKGLKADDFWVELPWITL